MYKSCLISNQNCRIYSKIYQVSECFWRHGVKRRSCFMSNVSEIGLEKCTICISVCLNIFCLICINFY